MANHVYTMFKPADEYAQDVEGVFLGRCIEDRWSVEMRACILGTRSVVEPQNCKAKLTAEQGQALEKALDDADERNANRQIPQVCARYEQVLAKVMACETFPKSERDALQKRFDDAKRGWPALKNKRELGPICASAITAVKQAASECPGANDW